MSVGSTRRQFRARRSAPRRKTRTKPRKSCRRVATAHDEGDHSVEEEREQQRCPGFSSSNARQHEYAGPYHCSVAECGDRSEAHVALQRVGGLLIVLLAAHATRCASCDLRPASARCLLAKSSAADPISAGAVGERLPAGRLRSFTPTEPHRVFQATYRR